MPLFALPPSALPLTVPYLNALLANDSAEALRLALDEGLHKGVSAPELQLHLLAPAQHEIGRLWQENTITVAQEHLATSISQLVLSHLYRFLPRSQPNGRCALVACVPGEMHDVGARMGADFLEMAGFEVHFLGANVPTESLLTKISALDPDLLGLSATIPSHAPALRSTVAAVRELTPSLPIIVGGSVLDAAPRLAEELGVQVFGKSAKLLAEASCQLFTS